MLTIMERRVTRSLSAEIQARLAMQVSGMVSGGNMSTAQDQFSQELNNSLRHDTSDEMFLKGLMDANSSQPSMVDMLGLTSIPQVNRHSSEELFQNWLSNPEQQQQQLQQQQLLQQQFQNQHQNLQLQHHLIQGLPNVYQNRRMTRRISNELAAVIQQNQTVKPDERSTLSAGLQSSSVGTQANPFTFIQSSPVTRSRSNELRRIASLNGVQIASTDHLLQQLAMHGELGAVLASFQGIVKSKPSVNSTISGQNNNVQSTPPHQSSTAAMQQGQLQDVAGRGNLTPTVVSRVSTAPPKPPYQPPLVREGPKNVSAVVNMLKGSLERKKQAEAAAKGAPTVDSQGTGAAGMAPLLPQSAEALSRLCCSPGIAARNGGIPICPSRFGVTPESSAAPSGAASPTASVVGATPQSSPRGTKPVSNVATLMSPSEAGVKRNASGAAASEQPGTKRVAAISAMALPRARPGVGAGSALIVDSQPEIRKGPTGSVITNGVAPKAPLARSASITSSGTSAQSAGKPGDPSRHHRNERQRKMLEAKGRTSAERGAPGLDALAIKKKCDLLETEVRSLKTFQSFMNRKDSEQTTRIEHLEQENNKLLLENERLRLELSQGGLPSRGRPS